VHRINRVLPIGSIVLVSAFAFTGLATAADPPSGSPPPAAAPAAKPKPVNSVACTPATNGYQLCSSDKGALQLVDTPGAPSFYRLSLTGFKELRHNGATVYRSEEQHLEYDLADKTGEFVRAGAAVVTGTETCTYDDRAVFANNQLHRDLSNLTCGPSQ